VLKLKIGIFYVVSLVAGRGYGNEDVALVAGLLAGCGGVFYVDLAAYVCRRK